MTFDGRNPSRSWLLLLVGALLAAACDGSGGGVADPTPTSTSSTATPETTASSTTYPAAALAQTCRATRYEVRYPAGWSANRGDVAPACRFFHPEPFTLPPATEVLGLAIIFDLEEVPFSRLVDAAGGPGEEVLDRRETTVDGRRAVRLEARSLDGGLVPVGTPSLRYLVDVDGATLLAVTYGLHGADWDRNRPVLEAMVDSVQFSARAACSAAGLSPLSAPEDLPPPVAEMRRSIVAAATACDFERLAELASAGTFSSTFGQNGDPAAAWRAQEMDGRPVLRVLVELLDRPFATRPASRTQYLWPRAYAYERWSDVPGEVRDELAPLYGPSDFETFDRFGSYSGYRVGISDDGDWQFFIGGD